MKRLLTLCWLVVGILAMLMVFQVSNEAGQLEADLKASQRRILAHQEAIHVLQAEWSYLNRPAAIADLAKRHLDLQPLAAAQIIEPDHLPRKHAGPAELAAQDAAPDLLLPDLVLPDLVLRDILPVKLGTGP